MKKFHKKFNKAMEETRLVSLSDSEKQKMRDFLDSHIESNPITKLPPTYPKVEEPISSPFPFKDLFKKVRVFAPTALLLLVVLGGTAFASENALPGDVFYPAKILGENIKKSLTFGAQNKATVNADYAVLRLEEVEQLKIDGKLDNDKKAKLQTSFLKSSEESLHQIEKINKNNSQKKSDKSTEISLNFEAKLNGHKDTISKLSIDDENSDENTKLSSSLDLVLGSLNKFNSSYTSSSSPSDNKKEKNNSSSSKNKQKKNIKNSYDSTQTILSSTSTMESSNEIKLSEDSTQNIENNNSKNEITSSEDQKKAELSPQINIPSQINVNVGIPGI